MSSATFSDEANPSGLDSADHRERTGNDWKERNSEGKAPSEIIGNVFLMVKA